MVRAKNQAALAFQFVNGAVDGTVGTLFIHQNMLYNTENEEFLPVARRIGPMGNSQILLINEISDYSYHYNYRYHKELVEQAVRDLEIRNHTTYTHMEPSYVAHDRHPIDEIIAGNMIEYSESTIQSHEAVIKDIQAGTYDRYDYEAGFSDEELITEARQTINKNKTLIEHLRNEAAEQEVHRQLKDLEELVRIPQIMKEAIAEGGLDPA